MGPIHRLAELLSGNAAAAGPDLAVTWEHAISPPQATLDGVKFGKYFQDAPVINVPGRQYAVLPPDRLQCLSYFVHSHVYTLLIPVLGIVREPSIWSFITSPPSLKRRPDRAVVRAGGRAV